MNASRTWDFKDGFGTSLGAEIRGNEWAPLILIPLLAAIMLVASVLLLIIFRQHPTLVITTVAGCLLIVTIYLTFTTVGNVSETYE
ncbi:uncharacterized protein LOC123014170 [Tribolium madens]|uniref:uncharacterized protein LOC123014170 n=1 Tax=Tribolium madens TaxID=41895 RepID=UPI001CF75A78|nr:uncharacterized protein LOC123014170 [Tribolium madens]